MEQKKNNQNNDPSGGSKRPAGSLKGSNSSGAGLGKELADRELVEEELRKERDFISAVLDNTGALVVVLDQEGRITRFNRACEAVTGYTSAEVLGRVLSEFLVPPEDLPGVKKTWQALMKRDLPNQHQNRWIARDGSQRLISWSNTALTGASGEVEYIISTGLDITGRKRAEEELRLHRDHLEELVKERTRELMEANAILQTEIIERQRADETVEVERQRLNDVLEMLPVYVILLAPDHHVPFANRFFRERFGESYGQRCFEYLFNRHEACENCETYTVMKTKAPHRWAWTGPDGHNYDIFDFPFTDKDGSRLIMEVGIDVTEQMQAQEALLKAHDELEMRVRERTRELEVANRELESFSYSVSHDLRAPLRSLEGFSTALLEDYSGKLDDRGKQYLRYIRESSDLMGRLIDDLLKLSRITRSEISYEKVDLAEMARDILAELRRAGPEREAEVVIASQITAYGDHNLLRLVLENLLGNAWKFTGKLARARIEIGVSRQNGKPVYFVRDNGAGFDMNYADKLFQPFQRLHKASEFPGTGIGLATVQRIIRRHGGNVWAEGKIEEGATFYFTLGEEAVDV